MAGIDAGALASLTTDWLRSLWRRCMEMTLVGPGDPSGSSDGPGSLYAAHVQPYVALACLSIALLASTVTSPVATAAQPQPDPAPAAPAIVPDPAPATSRAAPAPPQQGTSTPYVQPQPSAPPQAEPQSTPDPSPAVTPEPDTAAAASSKPERRRRQARQRTEQARQRTEQARQRTEQARAANALPNPAVRMEWLTPRLEQADASQHVVLLAAGALLALLMASGSLISVAARATRGQLR
jgi:outer membrane biosynthesis protein TonB